MYFQTKIILKSNRYHNIKHYLNIMVQSRIDLNDLMGEPMIQSALLKLDLTFILFFSRQHNFNFLF